MTSTVAPHAVDPDGAAPADPATVAVLLHALGNVDVQPGTSLEVVHFLAQLHFRDHPEFRRR